MTKLSFFRGVETWLNRLVAVGFAACVTSLLALIFILATGCNEQSLCKEQSLPVCATVQGEGCLYEILSVHTRPRGELLVSLRGRRHGHRMSVAMTPAGNLAVPEPGDVWALDCADGRPRLTELVQQGRGR